MCARHYNTAIGLVEVYRSTSSGASLVDLPLHGSSVVSTEREEIRIVPRESHLGHMTTVADEWRELRAFNHRWVAIELDLAIIVSRSDDLLTICKRSLRSVGMVDVRSVLTWLPDTLHGPAEHAGVRVPNLVTIVGSSACVLGAVRD